MSTTLIFGGSGKVARHITSLLTTSGNTVHSIIRNPAQIPSIQSLGGHAIVQSIEDSSIEDFVRTIQSTSPNTIIWAAGAGGGNPERTSKVDYEGAVKVAEAVAQAGGTKRYIVISALDVRDRDTKPEPEWYDEADRDRSEKVWKAIGPYMRAKFAADKDLVENNGRRGLEYTIVRPGGLSEEKGTGKVEAGKVHLNRMVPREDVARVVVECIQNEGTKGLAFDVVGGDELSVEEAVEKVAKGRVDTFEGRH
ncbi:hypothetical protein CERZMDRAFT_93465 [Cercospora zeae-maydis SCOH1-5]|uniref:NAD(P)-binding domain-containing protein n=1 Tax=Cercospora zeae-maydis SCOH1-5 TaxID=717836 RepID=A0A6A6FRQ7_9PEZI|nr:hypothetical protein CERZMDRAFT_93465 [Cercospora zeae-maydis SCOH1-5]